MVAKSYAFLEWIGEPFEENKRMYIFVKTKAGAQKKVRWYSENEYYKMYPDEKPATPVYNDHQLFGFGEKNYIWVFPTAGNETDEVMLEFNRETSLCQYATFLGWFCNKEEILTHPKGRRPVKLDFELIRGKNRDQYLKIIKSIKGE